MTRTQLKATRRRDGLLHYGYHLGRWLLWCHPLCWHRQETTKQPADPAHTDGAS